MAPLIITSTPTLVTHTLDYLSSFFAYLPPITPTTLLSLILLLLFPILIYTICWHIYASIHSSIIIPRLNHRADFEAVYRPPAARRGYSPDGFLLPTGSPRAGSSRRGCGMHEEICLRGREREGGGYGTMTMDGVVEVRDREWYLEREGCGCVTFCDDRVMGNMVWSSF